MGYLVGGTTVPVADVFRIWRGSDQLRNSGRLNRYWADLISEDPLLRSVVMVVDLAFGGLQGGVRIRLATQPVKSVSGSTGRDHSALAGILSEPEIEQVYTVGEGVSAARSVSLTVDAKLVNPIDIIAAGGMLTGFAEVALEPLLAGGADYDRRLVILRGDMSGGSRFGAVLDRGTESEILDIEISDPRESAASKLPPWVYDDARGLPHANHVGQRIPLVINRFNGIPAVRITTATTGQQRFVFGLGVASDWTVNTASGVAVNGVVKASGDATYGWSASDSEDGLGVRSANIFFTNISTVWADNDVVHVDAASTDKEVGIVGVVEEIVRRYSAIGTAGLNYQLFADAEARLSLQATPRCLVNAASGGAAGTAIEWLETAWARSFPMLSMVWQGGGYGPVLTDFRLQPVAHWVAPGPELFDRVSMVQELEKARIYNDFVLRYDYDPIDDVFSGVKTRHAGNSSVCEHSRGLVGAREFEPIESLFIDSDELADWVLDWLVAHMAIPSYYVEYEGPSRLFVEHRRGDPIQLTDTEFGWDKERATIERLTYRRGRCVVGLRVWLRYIDLGGAAFSFEPRG